MNVKRTPGDAARCFMARSDATFTWDFEGRRGGSGGGASLLPAEEAGDVLESWQNESPVTNEHMRRTVKDRQRMTRETRAGRLCHVSVMVPKVRMMRREVRM